MSLTHAVTVLQLCMCSRNNTTGSIQVTDTEVERVLTALTFCGTEGTEHERRETNTKVMMIVYCVHIAQGTLFCNN